MTIQELATAYKDVDVDTLDFIEAVLQWRRNIPPQQSADMPEVWRKLKTLLKKEDEVGLAESTRLAILDESSRLISQRNSIRKEIEAMEAEINELKRDKETLDELTQNHANLEREKTEVQKKRTEMQRKCRESQKLVKDGQSNVWLQDDVKDNIQRIWNFLPLDTLDMFLKEK